MLTNVILLAVIVGALLLLTAISHNERAAREFAEAREHLSAGLCAVLRLLLSLAMVGTLALARGLRRLRRSLYPYKCLDCGKRGHRECDGSRRELESLVTEIGAGERTGYLGRLGGRAR